MTNNITREKVDEQIARLDLIFTPSRSNHELRIISDTFFDIFKNTSEEKFHKAVQKHIERGKFFPRPYDLKMHLADINRFEDLKNSRIENNNQDTASKGQVKKILKRYREKARSDGL